MKSFKSFRLDTANQCLWRGEERVAMAPKAFDVLRYLVENPRRLVTQDEVLEKLWPETYVKSKGNSIAVLPFVDMSSGKDQEYFSDGLSEQLINDLAKVSGLKVVGRDGSSASPTFLREACAERAIV